MHWVVPSVLLLEGVHAGSLGPLYYPPDEIERSTPAWNYKPVVVNHPMVNGVNVSACRPDILNTRRVGLLLNSRYEDGKLKADVWIEKLRAENISPTVVRVIRNGWMMELSTGLFLDVERTPGRWRDEDYIGIARNYRPDHLALLPDDVGAVSIADGAGFMRNQATWNAALARAQATLGGELDPVDVTDDGLVVRGGDRMWLVPWDEKISPTAVQPGRRYVVFGGNSGAAGSRTELPAGGNMLMSDDKSKVPALDAASPPTAPPVDHTTPPAEKSAAAPAGNATTQTAAANTSADSGAALPNRPPTIEEYLAAAPANLRDVLENALDSYRAERNTLVQAINAAPGNMFTNDELAAMPIGQLRKVAQLADAARKAQKAAAATNRAVPHAAGDGGADMAAEEPLPLPRFSFGKRS